MAGRKAGHSVLRMGVLMVDQKVDWKADHSVLRMGGLMVD